MEKKRRKIVKGKVENLRMERGVSMKIIIILFLKPLKFVLGLQNGNFYREESFHDQKNWEK